MKKKEVKKVEEEVVVEDKEVSGVYSVYNGGGDFIRSYSSKKVAEGFAKKIGGKVK